MNVSNIKLRIFSENIVVREIPEAFYTEAHKVIYHLGSLVCRQTKNSHIGVVLMTELSNGIIRENRKVFDSDSFIQGIAVKNAYSLKPLSSKDI